jgi:hypothetical protein
MFGLAAGAGKPGFTAMAAENTRRNPKIEQAWTLALALTFKSVSPRCWRQGATTIGV